MIKFKEYINESAEYSSKKMDIGYMHKDETADHHSEIKKKFNVHTHYHYDDDIVNKIHFSGKKSDVAKAVKHHHHNDDAYTTFDGGNQDYSPAHIDKKMRAHHGDLFGGKTKAKKLPRKK